MSHDNAQPDPSLDNGPTSPEGVGGEWEEARRRRRMLEGCWADDLNKVLREEFAVARLQALGVTRTTKNLFRSAVSQLAVIYDRPGIVGQPDEAEASEALRTILDDAGFWQLAQTFSQKVIGIREAAYRFAVHDDGADGPYLQVLIITRDLFHAIAYPDRPDEPHTFYHYRQRCKDAIYATDGSIIAAEETIWTRDCISIFDLDAPVYRIESDDGKLDLTGYSFGGVTLDPGWPDQWRRADGMPFLPISLYHAQRTTKLTDTRTGIELVDGALMVAAKLMQWAHLLRDVSEPQRATMDATFIGNKTIDASTGTANVTLEAGSVMAFESTSPTNKGTFHQWDAGGDPERFLNGVFAYAADVLSDFDIKPSEIARTHTDQRSGYAISINREGERAAQRRYEPSFMRGDVRSCAIVSAMWNRTTGANLPERGWTVKYPGLPLSLEEKKLLLEEFKLRDELGVTSLPVLLSVLEGTTEDQARARLRTFAADRREFLPPGGPR